jgi:hypothetical protein
MIKYQMLVRLRYHIIQLLFLLLDLEKHLLTKMPGTEIMIIWASLFLRNYSLRPGI